jgi:uncharacterized membrane protein
LKLSPDKLFSDLKSKSLKPNYGKLFSDFASYFPTGLMCVAFIPYPTALIGEYGSSLPVVVFYGLSLAITGFAYNVLWFYVVRRYIKAEKLIHQKVVQKATIWTLSYPISYLVAAGLAFISINLSIILYALIPAFYLLPGIIDEQLMEQA